QPATPLTDTPNHINAIQKSKNCGCKPEKHQRIKKSLHIDTLDCNIDDGIAYIANFVRKNTDAIICL
ncbi:TPA: hypothetical protein ACWKPE_003801, partial [Escherichia coli]